MSVGRKALRKSLYRTRPMIAEKVIWEVSFAKANAQKPTSTYNIPNYHACYIALDEDGAPLPMLYINYRQLFEDVEFVKAHNIRTDLISSTLSDALSCSCSLNGSVPSRILTATA